MAIPDELAQLQTNLSTVATPAGYKPIQRVYKSPLSHAPTTEDLPAIVIFIRAPRDDNKIEVGTFSTEWRTTKYTVQFIYLPIGQGLDLETNFNDCLQWCEPILNVLWAHTNGLNNTTGVQWAVPTIESMPHRLPEAWGGPGNQYFGMDFSVTCVAERAVTIGI